MNIEEFLNICPQKYNTYKKAKQILKKASYLEPTPEVQAKIKEIELYLKYSSINDFFPTPKKVADAVAQFTNFIYSGFNILEPSAGTGNLANAIKSKYTVYTDDVKLDCIEVNYELAEYLKSKSYNVFNCDFLEFKTNKKYDLIIMNPPFKDLLNHLNKALELLKPNGQLLCIVPNLTQTKYKKFIDKTGAFYYNNLNFDFTEAKTGCICQLLEINMQKIENFALMLFDFFCREDYEYNFIDKFFSLYLDGSYGYKIYEQIQAVKSPSTEQLFNWLIDFLSIEFNFSKVYIAEKLSAYKLFSYKLVDYYNKYIESNKAVA